MPRQYNKKSPYWEKRKKLANQIVGQVDIESNLPFSSTPEDCADSLSAFAACGGGPENSLRNIQRGVDGLTHASLAYSNIRAGMLPYEARNGSISVEEAIELCQKAYANIAVVRNAVEVLTEFSNSAIHIKTKNKTAKKLFEAWFRKIDLFSLKDQFFREFYRSGNIFYYRIDGKFSEETFKALQGQFDRRGDKIPVRYILLNPCKIHVRGGYSYENTYVKALSAYEIKELAKQDSDESKAIFNALPSEVQKQIKSYRGGLHSTIYMPMKKEFFHSFFYKKQDYEPLSIPMVFPVLNDLEWKLMLQKTDMALIRSIEHAFLLVKSGDKDKGVNPASIEALKNIFKNQTVGRTLVHDWSTTAEWVIPDIKELLGKEKYEAVNENIKNGLQTIIFGEERLANAEVKAQVFIERLRSGREYFIHKFLQPEMQRVAEALGIKGDWKVEFEEVRLQDPINLQRLYVRLGELGLLAPWEVSEALNTGVLPEKEDNLNSQEEYKKHKEKDYYLPLIGGGKRPGESNPSNSNISVLPSDPGRPSSSTFASEANENPIELKSSIMEEVKIGQELKDLVEKALKTKYKLEDLNSEQKTLASMVAKIMYCNDASHNDVNTYIENPPYIKSEIASKIDEIMIKRDCDEWSAAYLLKALEKNTKKV